MGDNANCGACGNACAAGTVCAAGTCTTSAALVVPVTLSSPQYRTIFDEEAIYHRMGTTVTRVDKMTFASVDVVASTPNLGGFIAVDSQFLYGSTGGGTNDTIWRVPKHGGPMEVMATGASTGRGMSVDDVNLYWASMGHASFMRKTPGAPVTKNVVTYGMRPAEANDVAWVYRGDDSETVQIVSKTTGKPIGSPGSIHRIGSITPWGPRYIMNWVSSDITKTRWSLNGLSQRTSPLAAGHPVWDLKPLLASDPCNRYFVAHDKQIIRFDGTAEIVIARTSDYAEWLAVDDVWVYWTEKDGLVRRIPKWPHP